MLEHEYIYDYITYWTLAAEIYPGKIEHQFISYGAAVGAIASLISRGQDLRSDHEFSAEEDSLFWVTGH